VVATSKVFKSSNEADRARRDAMKDSRASAGDSFGMDDFAEDAAPEAPAESYEMEEVAFSEAAPAPEPIVVDAPAPAKPSAPFERETERAKKGSNKVANWDSSKDSSKGSSKGSSEDSSKGSKKAVNKGFARSS